mmetsp:Transcript_2117/g.4358  ORF Transcript_2117/g.4358 Transcript_2117/m.4358 type:complete len:210 (-) Transcript_2117:141-770(-)
MIVTSYWDASKPHGWSGQLNRGCPKKPNALHPEEDILASVGTNRTRHKRGGKENLFPRLDNLLGKLDSCLTAPNNQHSAVFERSRVSVLPNLELIDAARDVLGKRRNSGELIIAAAIDEVAADVAFWTPVLGFDHNHDFSVRISCNTRGLRAFANLQACVFDVLQPELDVLCPWDGHPLRWKTCFFVRLLAVYDRILDRGVQFEGVPAL